PTAGDLAVVVDAVSGAVQQATRRWTDAKVRGDDGDEDREQEERAWRMALWTGRRLDPQRIRSAAAATLTMADAPASARVEAAHALGGTAGAALTRAASATDVDVRAAAISALGQPVTVSPPDPVALARAAVGAPTDAQLASSATRTAWLPVALRSGQVAGL